MKKELKTVVLVSGVLFQFSLASTLDNKIFKQVMSSMSNKQEISRIVVNKQLINSDKFRSDIDSNMMGNMGLPDRGEEELLESLSDIDDKIVGEVKSEQTGLASWYGKKFQGRKTASGEKFDMYQMTAAHKKLPLNTKIRVTNLKNNKSVTLKVNDRGPYSGRRILDVSYAAAQKLGFSSKGVASVKIEVLE